MINRINRLLPALFAGSLLINALLLGLLLGGGLAKKDQIGPPPDRGERGLVRALESSVSEENRREIRGALRQAYGQNRDERRGLSKARKALQDALRADPYDAEKVKAAFAALRTAEVEAQQALHDELALQFERLSPEARVMALRKLSQGQRRGPRREQRPPNRPGRE